MPILIRILILLCLAAPVSAQPVIRQVSPGRNSNAASRDAAVSVRFSAPMLQTQASAGSVQVFSSQRGGKMFGQNRGTATVQDSSIRFKPARDFLPGELVFVTTTTDARSVDSIPLARSQVHEFRAAVGGGGRGSFTEGFKYPVRTYSNNVISADFDGDGDLDLLSMNCGHYQSNNPDTGFIHVNNGRGDFSILHTIYLTSKLTDVLPVDVDSDGDLDMISQDVYNDRIFLLVNHGNFNFTSGQDIRFGNLNTFTSGDIDADGDQDILAITNSGSTLAPFLNSGNGTFTPIDTSALAGGGVAKVALADLNNDGYLDLFTGCKNESSIRVATNSGLGLFSQSRVLLQTRFPDNFSLGDLDNDGDLDLAHINDNAYLATSLNDGSGTFLPGSALRDHTWYIYNILLADLDADADLDIVCDGFIIMNDGRGGITIKEYVEVGDDATSFKVGDFDLDEDIDIAGAAAARESTVVFLNQGPPSVTEFTPTHGPAGTVLTLTGTSLIGTTAIRFTGSSHNVVSQGFIVNKGGTGITDIVVPPGAQAGPIRVVTGNGTSPPSAQTFTPELPTFEQPRILSLLPELGAAQVPTNTQATAVFSRPMAGPTATGSPLTVMGNFSGSQRGHTVVSGNAMRLDASRNLLPGERAFATISKNALSADSVPLVQGLIHEFRTSTWGTGRGNFDYGQKFSFTQGIDGAMFVDFDSDGDLDIIMKWQTGLWGYTNKGQMQFDNMYNDFRHPYVTQLPVPVDFDGDGDIDLASSTLRINGLVINRNNGQGEYTLQPEIAIGGIGTHQPAFGDWDADGDQDIAVPMDSALVLLYNDGSTHFTDRRFIRSSTLLGDKICMGDLDKDGRLDIIVQSKSADSVIVFIQGGTGRYAAHQSRFAQSGIRTLNISDLNGDGYLDILTSNFRNGTILLNNGRGGLQEGYSIDLGIDPNAVALGDVDADGDIDIAAAAFHNQDVIIRFNDGTGKFPKQRNITLAIAMTTVCLGDLDGDGDLDLAAATLLDDISPFTSPNVGSAVFVRRNDPDPAIVHIRPASGYVGDTLTLYGQSLHTVQTVVFPGDTLNTVSTGFRVDSAGTLITRVVVPPGAQSGTLQVTSLYGTSTSSAEGFTLLPPPGGPRITGFSPARNATSAPPNTDVSVSFSSPMADSSAGALLLFSDQHGGRKYDQHQGTSSVSGNTIRFNPAEDFRPGERIQVTTTTAARSAGDTTLVHGAVHEFFAASSGNGLGYFGYDYDWTEYEGNTTVKLADMDNDSDLDIVVSQAGRYRSIPTTNVTVTIRKNDSKGYYDAGSILTFDNGEGQTETADIDGDGDLDMIVELYGKITFAYNDGNGNFNTLWELPRQYPVNFIEFGDLDADGDLDFITTDSVYLSTYQNNGSGQFTCAYRLNTHKVLYEAQLADLDNDGDLDVVYIGNKTGYAVGMYVNSGSGRFSGSRICYLGTAPTALTVGDIDSDGDVDIVAPSYSADEYPTLSVCKNDGIGNFSVVNVRGGDWIYPMQSHLVDIDADGDLDLVQGMHYTSSIVVWPNLGGGVFSPPIFSPTKNYMWRDDVGDIDGDGDVDVISCGSTWGSFAINFNQGLPTITDFTPTTGPAGTILALRGRDLRGVTAVTFTGTGGNIVSSNLVVDSGGTRITGIVVPPGTRTGPLTVTTQAGTSAPSTQIFTLECAGLYTPAVSTQGPTAFCSGDSVRLSTSDTLGPNQRFLWSTGDTARQITVRSPGTYSLRIRSTHSTCVSDSSAPVSVQVAAIPAIAHATPLRFCDGDFVILQGPDRPDETCLWSTGDTTRQIIVHGSGTYSLRMRARSLNCTSSWADSVATLAIALPARPTIMAASPLTFCQGDSALLTTADTLRPGQFFRWNTGDTGRTLLTRVSGTYSLQIRSSLAACVSDTSPQMATQQISLSRPVAVAQSATSFCSGDSVVLLAPAIPASQSYRWSTGDTTRRLIVRQSGVYTLRVLSRLADCASPPSPAIITDSISVPRPPVITALGPTRFYLGDSVILQGSPITPTQGYLWSTGDTARRLVVRATGRYTLRIVSSLAPCTSDTGTGISVSATPIPDWPTITSLSPTANSGTVPRNSDVVVNFSRPMSAASASTASVQVFSSQRGGKMYGNNRGTASASGNSIRFDPAQDFMPGERVFVTTTTAARSTDSLALQHSYVHEFTTATGGTGRGYFRDSSILNQAGSDPAESALGDIDGDGDLDLAVVNAGSNTVSTFLNGTSGHFSPSQQIPAGAMPTRVLYADLDNDGDLDLATLALNGEEVRVFKNNGLGTFSLYETSSTGYYPYTLSAADTDMDGDLDLIVGHFGPRYIYIYSNSGTGNFHRSQQFYSTLGLISLSTGDIDSDGDIDIIACNREDSVYLHINDGAGNYPTRREIHAHEAHCTTVFLQDLDGDNDLDIILAGCGQIMEFWKNLGDGQYQYSYSMPGVRNTERGDIRIGDVDADGDPDILYVYRGMDGGVVLYRQDGQLYSTGEDLYSNTNSSTPYVSLGDIDGDYDMDLIVTDWTINSISILFNESNPTATTPLFPTPTLLAVPNPATAAFHLQGLEKPAVADLLDATGRLVRSFKTTPGQELNLEGLAQGLYRWRCQGQSGNLIVR